MWVILLKKKFECDTIKNISQMKMLILWRAAVASAGGLYYASLEVLWRGYSHWTMILVGGAAVFCMYNIFNDSYRAPLAVKCLLSAFSVCVLEFLSGCVINLWLGLQVWDYSQLHFNILGQVCPLFFGVWFVFSIPASYACRIIHMLEDHIVFGGIHRGSKKEEQ